MGRLRFLCAAVAFSALLAGCGSSSPPPGLSVKVEQSPFRISLLRDGKPVVEEAADARLRYRLASGEEHALTKVTSADGDRYTVATDEPGRTATVTVAQTAAGVDLSVALDPAAGVREVYDAFGASPADHFLGGGERTQQVDLSGKVWSVKVGGCSYAPIPYFASTAGWGLRLASENVSALAFPGSPGGSGCTEGGEPTCSFPALTDRAEVCVQGARLDEHLYAGALPRVLAAYQADAGEPAVPPDSELALFKWRDIVDRPGELLDDVHRLRAAGIPIGWVILDNPWETGGCNGLLTFDLKRIPDPKATIAQLHALGVKLMLWVSPRETCSQGYPAGSLLGDPGSEILDLRRPAAVAEFRRRLRRLFALGVDGVKGDRGDENDLASVDPSLTNAYPLLYARAVIGAMPKGGAAIFRAATVGSQAVLPGIWAGDQQGLWSGLQQAIVAGQSAAMSGFPTWGSDVGGYTSLQPTPVTADVFERWAQLGAISPVMEVGGIGPNATPWTLGADAMAALRAAAVLHYELYPLFHDLLTRHEPVLRPLGYAFPDDAGSWQARYELMVGPDLLAAPVAGPGTTPSVYLPPGSWVDLATGALVQGGGPGFTRETPMDVLPLYARSGAVVPFDLRTATGSWWGVDELGHPGRAGFLATNGAVLDLAGQPRDVQIFVPAGLRPHSVTIGGKAVAWTWNDGPLPGAVIRLHGPAVRGRVVVSQA